MQEYGLTHPLTALALAYIAKDILPWCGVQLVACGKWLAPQVERIVDALVASLKADQEACGGKSPDTTPAASSQVSAETPRDEQQSGDIK